MRNECFDGVFKKTIPQGAVLLVESSL